MASPIRLRTMQVEQTWVGGRMMWDIFCHAGLVPASNVPHTEAMRERLPCVYMMASGFLGTLYVGVTSNLVGRVMQHREGTFEGFTKRYGCELLVWYDVGETMETAIAREKTIKKWPRDWTCNLIERTNPEWNDLAVGLGLEPLS
ncbi:GIY-YIG nuclease family protein [Hephaestia caeni]|uniref:GIY-YIG nuclease family protein n=1 Tax=Hephaestia caeni TaxID=645617 RepID=UPI00319E7391